MAEKKNSSILGVDSAQIKAYAEFFSKNNVEHLHIKRGAVEIEMKQDAPHYAHAPRALSDAPPAFHAAPAVPVEAPAEPSPETFDASKYAEVISPIVGTFYATPSPGAPAFVKVGDLVDENSVVAIVEAMKMMNELKAGIKGKVAKALVAHGAPVQAGQSLFLIEKG